MVDHLTGKLSFYKPHHDYYAPCLQRFAYPDAALSKGSYHPNIEAAVAAKESGQPYPWENPNREGFRGVANKDIYRPTLPKSVAGLLNPK